MDNSQTLTELFNEIILKPQINVCTDELKGASILDTNILRLLSKQKELPLKHLSQILQIQPSTLGSAIKRLEQKELIQRKMNQQDLRSYLISITEKGQTAIDEMFQRQEKVMSQLLRQLTEEEQSQFISLLGKMFR